MNAQLKFDHLERSNLRAHQEDVAAKTLLSIARHRMLIASLVVIALVLAAFVIPQLPRKYSAEVLVHPDLFAREESTKVAPLASIDAAALVTSEARLIRSDAIVRAVVSRLGLEDTFAASRARTFPGMDRIWAAMLPEIATPSPLERASNSVRDKLTVTSDTRSYLIAIGFTAGSPETAAKVVNSFAIEYLKAKMMQRRADAMMAASREVAQRSAIFGEKHPSIVRARAELEAARMRLLPDANWSDKAEHELVSAEGVALAEPNSTLSGPKGLVIFALAFISALILGIGIAVWRDRKAASLSVVKST